LNVRRLERVNVKKI